ncbi:Aldo/keto reductase [Laetiporus sulphureus 93-53]|uniref:Aldo/keto reductase n=1 Tax=Laetiporus sulphureus 93-53 TaxID=1314785 RepID=A0A165HJS2_9APHY|nr:Aldo/keto reductase [Laetiporus sulphureus 93-53]KZT11820.1 Aldo/keto reductase [Laetiporus sulphureus 93-53]
MPFGKVLLSDGNQMPTIAFGTGSKWKGHDVTDYVLEAIEAGFSHIDTAQYYANEESVAAAIRQSGLTRSEFFVTTKWSGQAGVRESLEASLSKLELKQIDLYLVHSPVFIHDMEKDWREFERAKEDGLVKLALYPSTEIFGVHRANQQIRRSIGVSNFKLGQLQQLMKIAKFKPVANQILFHPYNYSQNKELLSYCASHGVVVEAYGSLTPITIYPGGPVDKPVQAAADRLGATPTQVILSWVRSKGVVIVTTSSNPEHMREYIAVGDLPPLTEEEIEAIDAAGATGPPKLAILSHALTSHLPVSVTSRAPALGRFLRIIWLILSLLFFGWSFNRGRA